jgi:3-oxoacyl-[acyl-carrier protein] reductase
MITADLSGKVALVTGGASGIGLATVERLAKNGAKVAINDLGGNPRLEQEAARLRAAGHDVTACPGDVSKTDEVNAMVDAAVRHFGRLDFLVNNAATPGTKAPIPPGDFERQDETFWMKLLSINQVGPYRCLKAAAPHLREAKGAVVNVASTAGLGYGGSSSVYASTKAALIPRNGRTRSGPMCGSTQSRPTWSTARAGSAASIPKTWRAPWPSCRCAAPASRRIMPRRSSTCWPAPATSLDRSSWWTAAGRGDICGGRHIGGKPASYS